MRVSDDDLRDRAEELAMLPLANHKPKQVAAALRELIEARKLLADAVCDCWIPDADVETYRFDDDEDVHMHDCYRLRARRLLAPDTIVSVHHDGVVDLGEDRGEAHGENDEQPYTIVMYGPSPDECTMIRGDAAP